MLIRVVGWVVLVHILQIVIWGFFYAWSGTRDHCSNTMGT